ncbi:MAG: response regulator transcription factor [Bacteroidota bacterium]|nr:response regulator transcription factor [Bacteroidota bacterium]
MKYRIHITEDHQLLSDGLKSMLSEYEEIEINGTSSTGADTYKTLRTQKVDILLLDLNLPDANGVQIIDFIKNNDLQTKVIIVSMYYEKSYVNMARKRGAHAYVPKNVGKLQLINTIRKVISNGSFFEELNDGDALLSRIFTPREMEVLDLIKTGYDTQTIAEMLQITYETVRTHRKNLLQKAKANNIVKLINYISLK